MVIRRLVAVALAAGIGVSALYLPQALQPLVADEYGVDVAIASLPAALAQAGYAVGLLLFVPLSDRFHPYRQATLHALVAAAACAVAATTPDFVIHCVAMALVGLAGPFAQVLIPVVLRTTATAPATAAAVMSAAITIGSFGARLVGGTAAEVTGWRVVVGGEAALLAVAALVVALDARRRFEDRRDVRAAEVIKRLPLLVVRSGVLRNRALRQAAQFGVMQAIWSLMAVHLTSPAIGWTIGEAGATGIIGLVSGMLVLVFGHSLRRGGRRLLIACCSVFVVGGALLIGAGDLPVLILAVAFCIAFAAQLSHPVNQSQAIASAGVGAGGGANAVFMFTLFVAGTLGVTAANVLYAAVGYTAVAGLAITGGVVSLLLTLAAPDMRRPASPEQPAPPS